MKNYIYTLAVTLASLASDSASLAALRASNNLFVIIAHNTGYKRMNDDRVNNIYIYTKELVPEMFSSRDIIQHSGKKTPWRSIANSRPWIPACVLSQLQL